MGGAEKPHRLRLRWGFSALAPPYCSVYCSVLPGLAVMGFDVTTQRSLPLARTADAVVMARPRNFGFNEQTGLDNEFQSRPEAPAAKVNRRAGREFQDPGRSAPGGRGRGHDPRTRPG